MEKLMNRRLCQFRYENNSWKRVLEFIRQENILVKNHLAEVISFSQVEEFFLDDVEYLLNNLLQIETAVALIYKDIAAFENLMDRELFIDGSNKRMIGLRHSIIKDIRNAEAEFKNIRHKVDNFLVSTILS